MTIVCICWFKLWKFNYNARNEYKKNFYSLCSSTDIGWPLQRHQVTACDVCSGQEAEEDGMQ